MLARKKLDLVISKGGDVKADKKDGWAHFSLRIPQEMLDQIEGSLEKNIGQTKTNYILQAINEKLKGHA